MNERTVTCTCCGAEVRPEDALYVDASPLCQGLPQTRRPLYATTAAFAIGTLKMQATGAMTCANPAETSILWRAPNAAVCSTIMKLIIQTTMMTANFPTVNHVFIIRKGRRCIPTATSRPLSFMETARCIWALNWRWTAPGKARKTPGKCWRL